jgi:acetylornithine deacetylase/succinyl-diaminopimelate desuccinylase-like protein
MRTNIGKLLQDAGLHLSYHDSWNLSWGRSGAPYFTDASARKPAFDGAPTVTLGAGDMKLAHRTDEDCAVDKIEEAANIYEAVARPWCEMRAV